MYVLVANELCTYREVIAEIFREFRPHVEVLCLDPEDLDREMARLNPGLVVCSRLTEAVKRGAHTWVVLYPDGKGWAEVSIAGQHETVVDIEFDVLLSIIDQAEVLQKAG
jgi:hypothetical protein